MSNLPERQTVTLEGLGGQAALFEDPQQVMALTAPELRMVGVEIAGAVRPRLAEMRRYVGLVAWAMRAKVPAGEYGKWAEGYAELVGISVRTLGEWRSKVEAVNPYQSPRKSAGQRTQLAETAETPTVIPATSTEAPANQSAEGEPRRRPAPDESGEGGSTPPVATGTRLPSAGPSSEGVAKDSPAPTPPPLAPSSAGGDSVVGADAPPAGPIEHEWSPVTPQTVEVMRETMQVQRLNGDVHSNVFAAMVEHLLADRERPVDDADGLRWLSSKTEQEWRALGDPYGPGIRAKIKFAATAFGFVPSKPERRQGTITRPQAAVLAGRAVTAPRDLTRRDVAPMFKKGS